MGKKSGGLGSLITGIALGAAAVFFSKKENRDKAEAEVKKAKTKARAAVRKAKAKSKKIETKVNREVKKIKKIAKSKR